MPRSPKYTQVTFRPPSGRPLTFIVSGESDKVLNEITAQMRKGNRYMLFTLLDGQPLRVDLSKYDTYATKEARA